MPVPRAHRAQAVPSPRLAPCVSLCCVPGYNLGSTLLLAPGLGGPSAGGMFDRGVRTFSKQTLIHVSRRNLQTDSAAASIRGEMGSVNRGPRTVSVFLQTPLPVGRRQCPAPARPRGPRSVASSSPEPQPCTALMASIVQVRKQSPRWQVSCPRSYRHPSYYKH